MYTWCIVRMYRWCIVRTNDVCKNDVLNVQIVCCMYRWCLVCTDNVLYVRTYRWCSGLTDFAITILSSSCKSSPVTTATGKESHD